MMKLVLLFSSFAVLAACSSGNCRHRDAKTATSPSVTPAVAGSASEGVSTVNSSATQDRVRVYKPDGSLQCGQGKSIPLTEMAKELKGITVHGSFNKNDGMMRIQVCGAPTGNSNVYEIDRANLPVALKAGFKEWTFE